MKRFENNKVNILLHAYMKLHPIDEDSLFFIGYFNKLKELAKYNMNDYIIPWWNL